MCCTPVKCLIVDDLAGESAGVVGTAGARTMCEILTARSGAEALELLLVHDVALALLDVQMPEMDGFELAELLRGSERTRHIPHHFRHGRCARAATHVPRIRIGRGRFHVQAHRAAYLAEQGRGVFPALSAKAAAGQ